MLPSLPKVPRQCYSNRLDNLGNLSSNKEIRHNYGLALSEGSYKVMTDEDLMYAL